MNTTSILQWNIQGIKNKKDELLELIGRHSSSIVAIQEMKMPPNMMKLPNYTEISKIGHLNRSYHGGVALFIKSSVPFREVQVNSPLQVVAAEVNLRSTFTVCNIYNSRSHDLN